MCCIICDSQMKANPDIVIKNMRRKFTSLRQFYHYYLLEHRHPTCRALHFVGTSLFLAVVIYAIVIGPLWWLALGPISGYGFAWIGHFLYEKNKPATFEYPLFSLLSDFIMFWHMLTFQIPKRIQRAVIAMQDAK